MCALKENAPLPYALFLTQFQLVLFHTLPPSFSLTATSLLPFPTSQYSWPLLLGSSFFIFFFLIHHQYCCFSFCSSYICYSFSCILTISCSWAIRTYSLGVWVCAIQILHLLFTITKTGTNGYQIFFTFITFICHIICMCMVEFCNWFWPIPSALEVWNFCQLYISQNNAALNRFRQSASNNIRNILFCWLN